MKGKWFHALFAYVMKHDCESLSAGLKRYYILRMKSPPKPQSFESVDETETTTRIVVAEMYLRRGVDASPSLMATLDLLRIVRTYRDGMRTLEWMERVSLLKCPKSELQSSYRRYLVDKCVAVFKTTPTTLHASLYLIVTNTCRFVWPELKTELDRSENGKMHFSYLKPYMCTCGSCAQCTIDW
jgi:hypothetical protein